MSTDEKTGMQALERLHATKPGRPGLVERVEFEYVRHGTLSQPYGKPASTGTASQPGSQLYSSEQWNQGDYLAAFGISQLGARLYDPTIGRFLSRDPLLIPRTAATTNPYTFAKNDPVNRSDPSGLDDFCGTSLCKDNSTAPYYNGGNPIGWEVIYVSSTFSGNTSDAQGSGDSDGRGRGNSDGNRGNSSNTLPATQLILSIGGGTGSSASVDPWAQPSPAPTSWTTSLTRWFVNDLYGFGQPPPRHGDLFDEAVARLINDMIDDISNTSASNLANITNGIFDAVGAQHPGHAETVAEFRPGVHTAAAFTVHTALFLLLLALAPEGEGAGAIDAVARAREISEGLASAKCWGECIAHADGLISGLTSEGIGGSALTVDAGAKFVFSDTIGALGEKGAIHRAVRVGETVFDNMRPSGISFWQWIADLGGPEFLTAPRATLTETPF